MFSIYPLVWVNMESEELLRQLHTALSRHSVSVFHIEVFAALFSVKVNALLTVS